MKKIEYFEKFNFFELFKLLHESVKILKVKIQYNSSVYDFYSEFQEEINVVEFSNVADLTTLWSWFKPNSDWDLFTNSDEELRRKEIFEILDFWMQNH